jgi:hypothetical protein
MNRHVASGAHSAKSAPVPEGWGRREPPIHRRQDKSADRGRAHVVGGIGVSSTLSLRLAGARSTRTNDFNGPSAVARLNAKENSL